MKQHFFQKFSLIIIGLSSISLIVLLSPLARAYLPATYREINTGEPTIFIPKIGALAPIILDVDPWTPSIYEKALKKGVAHAKGSSYPGSLGTVFLFAHSTGTPWDLSNYNTVFFRLNELKTGDKIVLNYRDKMYLYEVKFSKIVDSKSIHELSPQNNINLILQTCTPPGTSFARLLVYSSLVSQ